MKSRIRKFFQKLVSDIKTYFRNLHSNLRNLTKTPNLIVWGKRVFVYSSFWLISCYTFIIFYLKAFDLNLITILWIAYMICGLMLYIFDESISFKKTKILTRIFFTILFFWINYLSIKNFFTQEVMGGGLITRIFGDNSYYVTMMREGIGSVSNLPWALRWITPLIAGPLNILPVSDILALSTINYAFSVLAILVLCFSLKNMKVPKILLVFLPFFFLNSYIGIYQVANQLTTDQFNFLVFAILLLSLGNKKYVPAEILALTIGVLNSEKIIFWMPIIAIVDFLREGFTVKYMLDTILKLIIPISFFLIIRMILGGFSPLEYYPENVRLIQRGILNNIYYPFGFLTIIFIYMLPRLENKIKAVSLLLLPFYLQICYATDIYRMTSYTFIIFIPVFFLYMKLVAEKFGNIFALALLSYLTYIYVNKNTSGMFIVMFVVLFTEVLILITDTKDIQNIIKKCRKQGENLKKNLHLPVL